jgi:hypothetical protein
MRASFIAAAVLVSAAVDTQAATLAVRGRANVTPSIAAADQFVAVAWGATSLTGPGTTDVFAAVSRNGGGTFAAPVRVNEAGSSASVGAEQPPRISVVPRAGRDPEVVVMWTAKSKGGTRLLVARSSDGGASYSRPTPIAASEAAGNRGWESTAVDPSGHVVALWLDHREMAAGGASSPSMHHEGHDHTAATPKADGAVRAQESKLYFANLDDPSSARAVTGGVCYCCKTAVASGHDGSIYAAWRHVYPGNIRDIAFTLSRDGGRTFVPPARVSSDRWELDGCPENGPSLAVGNDDTVHIVWPTLVSDLTADAEPSLALFYSTTRDGRAFSTRQRIATDGTPRHPQMIVQGRAIIAAWDEEITGGRRQVVIGRAAVGDGAGAVRFSREIVSDGARAQTPAIASVPDGFVIAWSAGADRSVIRVERL